MEENGVIQETGGAVLTDLQYAPFVMYLQSAPFVSTACMTRVNGPPQPSSRNLESRYLNQDSYESRVEIELRDSGFYHISQIGKLILHNALINALIERWRPETHTFHLPHGECTITLEDVAMIFGLPIDGMPVSGFTDSSTNGLENEFMTQFGIAPTGADHKGSGVKFTWLRTLKRRMQLDTALGRQMYIKIYLLLLFGTNLFCDKSRMTIHWKFLPLLRNFSDIRGFSWGSACLAHLYRALCQASRYDCKEVDGPLALLCIWAWERLPFLAPMRSYPSFPLACSWMFWRSQFHRYQKWTISHIMRLLDDIHADGFVWNPYSPAHIENIVVPNDILSIDSCGV
ncbi:protein MAIN-LIKE 1-like [Arachis hypogaea]|uniref:protein MAIN-LIKE 1-like n=1 Tax=Arachis hypogaea TaxID=3818 RepID=UPI000DED5E98|nr:serine/threonine-protein phosphatase 7 long form homolog [Arachis hypogaea]